MSIKPPAFIMIPRQLLTDEHIKSIERELYGYIYWISKMKNEKCTASNESLAELVLTTSGVVRNSLTNLEKRGYIQRTFLDRNRRHRDEIIPLIDFNTIQRRGESRRKTKGLIVTKGAYNTEVNKLIRAFEPINPSFERLFVNKGQRDAAERLIKRSGADKIMSAVKFAIEVYDKPYAPTITTPIQLEHDLGKLIAYYKKEKGRGPKLVVI